MACETCHSAWRLRPLTPHRKVWVHVATGHLQCAHFYQVDAPRERSVCLWCGDLQPWHHIRATEEVDVMWET